MAERRIWTPEEDKVLKYLKDVVKVQKWSEISKRFQDQFHLPARNGKQCRQRYTNHLCDSIKFSEITTEEELRLFKMHDLLGNKWSQICKDFQGRTQNQIKNHFHSKLRKAIRKLNKQIKLYFQNNIQLYKLNLVYKIVEASDFRFFSTLYFQQDLKFFNDLKNLLIEYADGLISQKSFIQNLNGKEKVHFLLSQLDKFQNCLNKNKRFAAANKRNKKKSNRKICSNDKMGLRTVKSQLSESGDKVENQEKEMKKFWQIDLISSEMEFPANQGFYKSKIYLRKLEENPNAQLAMLENKIRVNGEESKQEEETGRVQNQKSEMIEENLSLIIPDFIKGIIEDEEVGGIPIQREFQSSFESLIEFEDNHLNDFEVRLMVEKFNSFSSINSALFE